MSGVSTALASVLPTAGGNSLLVDENFSSATKPPAATESGSGTFTYGYTTNPPSGASTSVRIVASSQQPGLTWSFAAQNEVYVRCQFRFNTLPDSEKSGFAFDFGGLLDFRSDGTWIPRDGSGGSVTVDSMATGTWYYFQGIVKKGTGSNAVLSLEWNTSNTFTGSGNKFSGETDGANTTQISSIKLGWAGDGNASCDWQIGTLQVSATPFP